MNSPETPREMPPTDETASRSARAADAWVLYALSPAPDTCHALNADEVAASVRSLLGELLANNAEVRPLVFATLEPLFAAGDVLRVELPSVLETELAQRLHEGGWRLERLDEELKALDLPTADDPPPLSEGPASPAAAAAETEPPPKPPESTAPDTPQ